MAELRFEAKPESGLVYCKMVLKVCVGGLGRRVCSASMTDYQGRAGQWSPQGLQEPHLWKHARLSSILQALGRTLCPPSSGGKGLD